MVLVGIYEPLIFDVDLGAEVTRRKGVAALRSLADEKGMRTLREDGLRQIRAGVTLRRRCFGSPGCEFPVHRPRAAAC